MTLRRGRRPPEPPSEAICRTADGRFLETFAARTTNPRTAFGYVGGPQKMSGFMTRCSWQRVSTGELAGLSSFWSVQLGPCFSPRLGQEVMRFWAALDGARFNAIGTTSDEGPF
jgi:hypothetical protein